MEQTIRLAARLGYLGSGMLVVVGTLGSCGSIAAGASGTVAGGYVFVLYVLPAIVTAGTGALGLLGASMVADRAPRAGDALLLVTALPPLGVTVWFQGSTVSWLQLFRLLGIPGAVMLAAAIMALWPAAKE